MPAPVHVHPVEVRFGDCDPAGIVYFPRFFDFFHQAMETWFGDALGAPYADVITRRKLGFPAVHTEADFATPCRLGDHIHVELRVRAVGRKSLTFDYRVRGATDAPTAAPRATGSTVTVVIDMNPAHDTYMRGRTIPDDLRAAIERWTAGARDE